MAHDTKTPDSRWAPTTEEGKKKLQDFYDSTASAFNDQFKLVMVEWATERELIKTTRQDKDDRYVR